VPPFATPRADANGSADKSTFLPYERDALGVRPWAIPGMKGLQHRIGGIEKEHRTGNIIYFSQARPQDEYVQVNREKDKYRYNDDYYDDRYLRMKVQNRSRWDYLDDWYSYNRYEYRYNYYYGSYFNPYTSWNYYYNPYSQCNSLLVNPHLVYIPVSQKSFEKPRQFNLNSYTNANYNSVNNIVNGMSTSRSSNSLYNNSNNTGLSNSLKQIFSTGNNNNSYSAPTRNYNPTSSSNNNNSSSTSSSGSSSSSSSSSGEVTRPKRGGN
jgi:hypothetical protein